MKAVTVVVLVAGVATGVWWAQRGRGSAKPQAPAANPVDATTAPAVAPAGPRPARPMPPRPVSPAGAVDDPAPGPGAAAARFEDEARDPAWAVDQERELAGRLTRLEDDLAARGAKVEIAGVECRASQCRFDVAAPSTGALSALYGAIETPEGLYGWADAVVLGGVDSDPRTGGQTTSITVVFERER